GWNLKDAVGSGKMSELSIAKFKTEQLTAENEAERASSLKSCRKFGNVLHFSYLRPVSVHPITKSNCRSEYMDAFALLSFQPNHQGFTGHIPSSCFRWRGGY
ncbi:hypothetical protein, partial [Pseudomonas viridiflava]|uniref:hypothetical protein n=1 Tax=Pseudomonas viridiflava TaxID=33069 RepID=UPI00197DCEC9